MSSLNRKSSIFCHYSWQHTQRERAFYFRRSLELQSYLVLVTVGVQSQKLWQVDYIKSENIERKSYIEKSYAEKKQYKEININLIDNTCGGGKKATNLKDEKLVIHKELKNHEPSSRMGLLCLWMEIESWNLSNMHSMVTSGVSS